MIRRSLHRTAGNRIAPCRVIEHTLTTRLHVFLPHLLCAELHGGLKNKATAKLSGIHGRLSLPPREFLWHCRRFNLGLLCACSTSVCDLIVCDLFSSFCVCRCVCFLTLIWQWYYKGWAKKTGTLCCVYLNFVKYWQTFRIRRSFVIILSLKIPPHHTSSVSLHYLVKYQYSESNNWKQADFSNITF